MIGFTHIQITNRHCHRGRVTAKPGVGTAEVLAQLMPQLWEKKPSERKQAITGLDHYMRKETEALLARIETHCEILLEAKYGLAKHVQESKFSLKIAKGECQLQGQFPNGLTKKLNQDPWLIGAFAWLIPNYLALVHSLELGAFSHAYQRSRKRAVATYQHFDEDNNGLRVLITFDSGKAQWCIVSPLGIYHL
jgi:hypothetical protein